MFLPDWGLTHIVVIGLKSILLRMAIILLKNCQHAPNFSSEFIKITRSLLITFSSQDSYPLNLHHLNALGLCR